LILVTFGTHPQPFERALDWALDLPRPLTIQHGSTPRRDDVDGITWHEMLDFGDLLEAIRKADAVVCHAGVGTVMGALAQGKVPTVIPRLAEHGEHIDDHQLQITQALGDAGHVIPCFSRTLIGPCVERASAAHGRRREAVGDRHRAVLLSADGDPARLDKSRTALA
jgi:UDP-N-acetylglucosamine transferase subunit ALG13